MRDTTSWTPLALGISTLNTTCIPILWDFSSKGAKLTKFLYPSDSLFQRSRLTSTCQSTRAGKATKTQTKPPTKRRAPQPPAAHRHVLFFGSTVTNIITQIPANALDFKTSFTTIKTYKVTQGAQYAPERVKLETELTA